MRLRSLVCALLLLLLPLGCTMANASSTPNSFPGTTSRAEQASHVPTDGATTTAAATSGPPRVSSHGPTDGKRFAFTFDDGFCSECIGSVVGTVERTGVHITFCPNGQYDKAWEPWVPRIKALIAKGDVVMCNHTVHHKQSTKLSDPQLRDELVKNDEWIERVFGVSSKPWFRPPFGDRNHRTDELAASIGYPQIVVWDGTVADWTKPTPEQFMKNFRADLHPGGILLAHVNQIETAQLFEAMINEARAGGFTLCTLPEMLGPTPPPARG